MFDLFKKINKNFFAEQNYLKYLVEIKDFKEYF